MGSQRQYLKSFQTSKMELFAKMVDGLKLLTIFKKCRTFDAWQCSQYVFGSDNIHIVHISATSYSLALFQPSGGWFQPPFKNSELLFEWSNSGFLPHVFSICNTLHKKWSFPWRTSSENETKSAGNWGFVTEEIFYGKLHLNFR